MPVLIKSTNNTIEHELTTQQWNELLLLCAYVPTVATTSNIPDASWGELKEEGLKEVVALLERFQKILPTIKALAENGDCYIAAVKP